MLGPFTLPGLNLSRTMYDTLPMPWSVHPPVTAFAKGDYLRKEWSRDGRLESSAVDCFCWRQGAIAWRIGPWS